MSTLSRINAAAGEAFDWFIENLFGWLIAALILFVIALPFIVHATTKTDSEFVAECRASCSWERLRFAGVELGSKRQCHCEVVR